MSSLVPTGPGRSTAAIVRQVAQQIEVAKGRAAVRSAEVVAVGYVVTTAMHVTADFSALEESLAEKSPLATSRLQRLGDCATARIGQIIAEL